MNTASDVRPHVAADLLRTACGALVTPLLPDGLSDLEGRAAHLLPIPRIGLECRLDDDTTVDLQQNVFADTEERRLLVESVAPGLHDDPLAARLHAFYTAWAADEPVLQPIDEVWLEHDAVSPTPTRPCVFVGLEAQTSADDRLEAVQALLDALVDPSLRAPLQATLQRFHAACPPPALLSHVGLMFSRAQAALRLNVKHLPIDRLPAFLDAVGWPAEGAPVEALATALFDSADSIVFCFDAAPDCLPRVGLECFLHDEPGRDPRWHPFLDLLQAHGLCTAARRAALFDWPATLMPRPGQPWPEALVHASLLREPHWFGIVRRKVNHVKVVYTPGDLEAKAYLGAGHLWRDASATTEAPKRPERTTVYISPATKSSSLLSQIERSGLQAIRYLVGHRSPSGWWRDYYECAGSSDEWVTAYVGTALASWPYPEAAQAALDAWQAVRRRQRLDGGWGYNTAVPSDADSSAWALRLALAVDAEDFESLRRCRAFMLRHRQPDGGLSTYLLPHCPELAILPQYRQAASAANHEAAFAGYVQSHDDVTAGAAAGALAPTFLPYLRNRQRPDGSWTAYWWYDAYATGMAVQVLTAQANPLDASRIAAAGRWAASLVQPNGAALSGYQPEVESAFATAWCLQILALATSDDETAFLRALKWLLDTQHADGAWQASAWMRVPPSDVVSPDPYTESMSTFLDGRSLFTTATVLTALRHAHRRLSKTAPAPTSTPRSATPASPSPV